MSDKKSCVSSPEFSKLLNSTNKKYSPCRRVGLKRKSTNTTPLHTLEANILKKKKTIDEFRKCIIINENVITNNTETKSQSITKLQFNKNSIQRNIILKQSEIDELKSQLKNSEQHNLDLIQELSNKWLNVCQEALTSLFNQLNQNQNFNIHTMEELIKNLGINSGLIHFDSNTQDFFN